MKHFFVYEMQNVCAVALQWSVPSVGQSEVRVCCWNWEVLIPVEWVKVE